MTSSKLLKNIAEVLPGHSFRSSLKGLLGDKIRVIQAKDINYSSKVDLSDAIIVGDTGFKAKFFTQKDDVILAARGTPRAGVIKFETENTIISTSVYIIRPTDKNINPEYLAIYLNSLKGQKLLGERMTGAAIKTILRRDLENIEVVVPSLEKQKEIIDIYRNNQAQQKLFKQKEFLINKISEGVINKILNS